ncbi:MAG: hypothetical protein J7M30_13505 [Deltaproteobacteria bacterium]|nr:hypothetical protein [Deltaproteobacteria bacterium]
MKKARWIIIGILFLIVLAGSQFAYSVIKWRTYIWLPDYLLSFEKREIHQDNIPVHLFFIIVDHYEPGRGIRGIRNNSEWLLKYRDMAKRHKDHQGRILQHTWFYPLEQFENKIANQLSDMVHEGYGEIEVHWHHGNDTADSFESKLSEGIKKYCSHGALIDENGRVSFAFVHGNWSLDNSCGPRVCGVNNELKILARNGCYADFTFSTIGTNAQPKKINSIYYAKDDDGPKSYNTGTDLAVGDKPLGDLMIFQGPIGYTSYFPLYLEYGAFEVDPKPSPSRLPGMVRLSVYVKGKPEWRFLKVYTHSQQSRKAWFDGPMDETLSALEQGIGDIPYRLHYVTAREAYNIAKAAEAGFSGPPEDYYDWLIAPPANKTDLNGYSHRIKQKSQSTVNLIH